LFTLSQLIETGKKLGYVLYSDVDELLPDDCEGGPELDNHISALESAGVEILVALDIKVGKAPDPAEYTDDVMHVYLRETGKVPQLARSKEIDLARLILSGKPQEAEAAKVQLVEANLRLVVPVAERYAPFISWS
jgi:RNA polymerase primary sigma factor